MPGLAGWGRNVVASGSVWSVAMTSIRERVARAYARERWDEPADVLIDDGVHVGDPGRRDVDHVVRVETDPFGNAVVHDLLHVDPRRGETAVRGGRHDEHAVHLR